MGEVKLKSFELIVDEIAFRDFLNKKYWGTEPIASYTEISVGSKELEVEKSQLSSTKNEIEELEVSDSPIN